MSRPTLEHAYYVTPNTKEDAAELLLHLADCDCDFNGENGAEYLWEDAEGFESNAKYCLSIAEQEKTPREMIERFVYLWMGRDPYYCDYSIGILKNGDNLFVSLAYTTQY